MNGTQTLNSNLSINSGITLKLNPGATVNLSNTHYSIISTGGTINKEPGATISNLGATLTHGTELKGLCGTVQAAVNAIPDHQYYDSYWVEMPNGSFSENVNIANKFDVWFYGSGSTTINGTVSASNCEGCRIFGFTARALSLSGCVIPDISVTLDIGAENPSLYAYNCTNLSFHDANVSDRYAYVNGTALKFNQSSTSSVTGSPLLYHNVRAILASASTVNLNSTYFCNNTYDLTTNTGATITALFCHFPGGVPSTQGSGIYVSGSYVADCGGIPKRDARLSKTGTGSVDTLSANS